jgi:hypothetical protein
MGGAPLAGPMPQAQTNAVTMNAVIGLMFDY